WVAQNIGRALVVATNRGKDKAMGESFSRAAMQCWDPEGTAETVRKKKQMRAAINQYDALLKRLELGDASVAEDLKRYDRENMNKGAGEFKGKFWRELQEHPDWAPLAQRRAAGGVSVA
ncbi:unnamed protein product, partial [Polarella glacialis]